MTGKALAKASVVFALAGVAAAAAAGWYILHAGPTGQGGSGLSPEFAYDTEEFRRVDPNLVLYRPAGRISTGLAVPRGLAVDAEGKVYVVGDRVLKVFAADGSVLRASALEGPASCVHVLPDGTVLAAIADRVRPIEAAPENSWAGLGSGAIITSISSDERFIYVGDAGSGQVLRLGRDGSRQGVLVGGKAPDGSPKIVVRSAHLDVAAGRDGLVRVANCGRLRVETYTPDGMLEMTWGKVSMNRIEDFCGCCNPTDIAVLGDGGVLTAEKGIPRVKLYDAHGQLLGVVAGPDAFDRKAEGMDLAVGPDGKVYVLDPAARTVLIFTRKESR